MMTKRFSDESRKMTIREKRKRKLYWKSALITVWMGEAHE